MKERLWTHKKSTGRKQAGKTTHLQTCYTFHEKVKKDTTGQRTQSRARRITPRE